MFNINNELSPPIVRELFNQRINSYNLRHFSFWHLEAFFMAQKAYTFGVQIWDIISTEFKELSLLSLFKKAINEWQA